MKLARGRVVLTVFLLASAGIGVVALSRTSEPSVRGRPLSDWLAAASDRSPANSAARTNAEEAIKELGPAAVPFLLQQLQTWSGWRERFGPAWNKFARRIDYRLPIDLYRADEIREQAVTGFEVFGTNAASALPKLRKLLHDERYVYDASRAIAHIKTDAALDALIPLLSHSNPRVRYQTVFGIVSFDDRERMGRAADEFARLTDDSDEDTARAATSFVGDLVPAERGISLLVRKFNDPRPAVVRSALGGFFAAGPHAEPAMPIIATMLTNRDEKTRRIATNVLLTINPYRAAEFGVITNELEERFYRIHQRIRQQFTTNHIPYLRQ